MDSNKSGTFNHKKKNYTLPNKYQR